MKLSDKLAALEEEEAHTSASSRPPAPGTVRRQTRPTNSTTASANRARQSAASWHASKRKVRELVLSEVAPKASGLSETALSAEVKTALDKILQREDV